jgi:hypothetical protein
MQNVLTAYANSLNRVFYLGAAFACGCGIFLWGMGWKDLRKKEGNGAAAGEDSKGVVENREDGANIMA